MPSPDQTPKTLKENIEEERLRQWREKRAKVAEASRQERIKQAEADRRARLEQFEEDKARRLREAAEKRAREDAAKSAERMSIARSKIAGRTDIEVARRRLLIYRKRAARNLALRLIACVVAPTMLIALYLLTVATPLYTSEVKFALQTSGAELAPASATPFSSTGLSQEAHVLREVLASPAMLNTLDQQTGFTLHLSNDAIDPLNRVAGPIPILSDRSALQRHVRVNVNGQDGIVTISTRAAEPKLAQDFAQSILLFSNSWLDGSERDIRTRVLSGPTLARTPTFPKLAPSVLLSFL
jgi:capsular polysaccharide transport system permease protein